MCLAQSQARSFARQECLFTRLHLVTQVPVHLLAEEGGDCPVDGRAPLL